MEPAGSRARPRAKAARVVKGRREQHGVRKHPTKEKPRANGDGENGASQLRDGARASDNTIGVICNAEGGGGASGMEPASAGKAKPPSV